LRIRSGEILDLRDYEHARARIRASAMAARAARRVQVGPSASVGFENRETVRYQIQEMLRAERIADPAGVAHEIETYGELLPGAAELCATLMLEFPDPDERARRLAELVGLERHLHLRAGDVHVAARFDERQIDPDRVSAVQFVRFPLPEAALAALRAGRPAALCIDHPAYRHEAALAPGTIAALLGDIEQA
jgi:uncharacterized protein DUF3501